MPAQIPVFGVPIVEAGQIDSSKPLPSLAAATMVVSVITPTKYRRNTPVKPLSGSYKVTIAAFGYDLTNGGYTFDIAAPLSSTQVVTSGSGILIRVANGGFGALTNIETAVGIAIFLQKGSDTPKLAAYGILDGGTDFAFLLMAEPFAAAPKFSTAVLTAATATDVAGDRGPVGMLLDPLTPTTRGVRFNHRTEAITADTDTSVAFQATTARVTDVEFSIVSNELERLVQATGGNYVKYTDTNGDIVEQAETDPYAIVATLTGNQCINVSMPPDNNGNFVTRRLIGNLLVNQQAYTEAYTKTDQFALDFTLQGAALDRLLIPMFSGMQLKRVA